MHVRRVFGTWASFAFLFASGAAAHAATPAPGTSPVPPEPRTLAAGLVAPDGLAFHPVTRELHVAEEQTGQISVLRDGKPEPVVTAGFEVIDDLPAWALTPDRPLSYWTQSTLRSPEGLCFSADGKLYVTEDAPNGRVLEFTADDQGRYRTARAVPIPWSQNGYAWESVVVARDGRLFVSGSAAEGGPGVFYGVVLMRDPAGEWWVVDYGPFASFTGLALAANDEVLVVGEEVGGSVSWWDTIRHEEIGFTAEVLPRVESVAVLADGTMLALQESTTPVGAALAAAAAGKPAAGTSRIVRIHPETAAVTEVARGFSSLEGLALNPATGAIVVSEEGTGRVLELPEIPVAGEANLMARAQHAREVTEGRGPKKWPAFLKDFFLSLGVNPVDEDGQTLGAGAQPVAGDDRKASLTLEQFAEKVPFVAGKVKVTRAIGPTGADPLDEVSFVLFYPNRTVKNPAVNTPSLSLFSARHRSGRVVRTRELAGFAGTNLRAGEPSGPRPSTPGSLYLPLASGNVNTQHGATRLSLSFLGVDVLDDYLVALNVGQKENGHLTLNLRKGGKEQYDVSFLEKDENGEVIRNLVVAGLEKAGSRNFGWYKLGGSAAPTLLTLQPGEMPFETRRTADLVRMIQSRQQDWQLAMGLEPETDGLELSGKPTPVASPDSYAPQLVRAEAAPRPAVAAGAPPAVKPAAPSTDRADARAAEQRADLPSGEQRAETVPDERQAKAPAKPADHRAEETIILSRALRAWEETQVK